MNDKQGKLHKIIRSLTMFTIDNTTHEDDVRTLLTQAGSLLEQARAAMGDGIPASGQRTKAKARTRPIVEPSDAAKELAAQGKALMQDATPDDHGIAQKYSPTWEPPLATSTSKPFPDRK